MPQDPQSYLVMDPGRVTGFAYCLAGGHGLKHGTWRFSQPSHGAAYAEFVSFVRRTLTSLPDPLVAMEMMTIVKHGEKDVIDPNQIAFSAGWQAIVKTLCHTMNLREPEMIAISTWRSKTHGKMGVPKNMKGLSQADRSKWLKTQAKLYCDANGWGYGGDDEAEALCMLDAVRIMHEPSYAFAHGQSRGHQSSLI